MQGAIPEYTGGAPTEVFVATIEQEHHRDGDVGLKELLRSSYSLEMKCKHKL